MIPAGEAAARPWWRTPRAVVPVATAVAIGLGTTLALSLRGGDDPVRDTLRPADAVPTTVPGATTGPTASPSPSESPYPLPSPPSDPTDGPKPVRVPGHHTIRLHFFNHDPTYRVLILVGDDRHGPFVPWEETGAISQDTYAGLTFRFVFPDRHACDAAERPLERPLEGAWWIGVERAFHDPGCAGPVVSYSDINKPDRWTEETAPPAPSPTPSSPAVTPTPTASPS